MCQRSRPLPLAQAQHQAHKTKNLNLIQFLWTKVMSFLFCERFNKTKNLLLKSQRNIKNKNFIELKILKFSDSDLCNFYVPCFAGSSPLGLLPAKQGTRMQA